MKQFYFLKLNPPRPAFAMDMSPEERQIMLAHIAYWAPYVDNGTVVVLGPVMDPEGPYGMAVLAVDDADEVQKLIAADPANGLNRYDVFPMRAKTKLYPPYVP
jgi:uncharacterized protein YciI